MGMLGPRALFLFPDESPQPDAEVCSGRYRDWLGGAACPHSDGGRMPLPEAGLGEQGSLPCSVAQLGRLSDWRGERGLQYPPELGRLRLHKCKQMLLLVVPKEAAEG